MTAIPDITRKINPWFKENVRRSIIIKDAQHIAAGKEQMHMTRSGQLSPYTFNMIVELDRRTHVVGKCLSHNSNSLKKKPEVTTLKISGRSAIQPALSKALEKDLQKARHFHNFHVTSYGTNINQSSGHTTAQRHSAATHHRRF